jgi:hypothetical protein
MTGKHAKPKQGTFRRNIAVTGTIAVGGLAIPATFAGSAHAEDSPSQAVATTNDSASTGATDTGAQAPADYIVKHGDDLSEIAARYGVDLSALEALNPGIIAGDRPDDYSLIFAGGHVHLPVGAHATEGKHARKSHVHGSWGHARTWYKSCDDAPAGLHRGQAGYRHALDMDGDGKACEGPWPPASSGSTGGNSGSSDTGSGDPSGTGGTTTPPTTNPDGTVIPAIAPDAPGTSSGYAAHSPSYWAPLIEQAKTLVGVNYDTAAIEGLMTSESGGDPNVCNNYDSNAAAGTPSCGLMQVIQPTFDANHVPGTSTNLFDPLANIAAALQYIKVTYGYVPNSPY